MNDDGRRGVASRPGILPAKRGDRGCCPGRETSSAAASALPCGEFVSLSVFMRSDWWRLSVIDAWLLLSEADCSHRRPLRNYCQAVCHG